MEITDKEIGLHCKDWVESRMPSEEQTAATSRMLALYLRTPREHQAELEFLRRKWTALAKNASPDKIDEVISQLELDVENLLPTLHNEGTKKICDEYQVLLRCLKGDAANLSDSQEQRIIACLDQIARFQAHRI